MLILWPNYVVYVTLTYINYGSGSYTGFCRIDDPDIQASETTVGIGVYRGRYSCRTAYHVIREYFTAVCAACGGEAKVPFEPKSDRPVYCSECFAKMRAEQ